MNRHICFLLCCTIVLAANVRSAAQGINTNDPNLPPIPSAYIPTGPTTYNGAGLSIVFSQDPFQPFLLNSRTPAGANELDDFNLVIAGQISLNASPTQPFSSLGTALAEIFNKVGNTTGTFQTEMLSMNLTGSSPFGTFQIRESPTLASTGQSSVTSIGGGLYHIDSFFDVFTELSIDGGNSWIPSTSSTHIVLSPEPTSLILVGVGLVCLAGKRRRRLAQ